MKRFLFDSDPFCCSVRWWMSIRKYAYRECFEIYQVCAMKNIFPFAFFFFFVQISSAHFSYFKSCLSLMSQNQNLNFQPLWFDDKDETFLKYFHESRKQIQSSADQHLLKQKCTDKSMEIPKIPISVCVHHLIERFNQDLIQATSHKATTTTTNAVEYSKKPK